MDPGGWIFAGACLNGNRSLYILPLKIKMPQHHSAVTGDQQTVPDKARKLLRNFIQCKVTQIQINIYNYISSVLHCTGSRNKIFHITANGF